jgi:hypothetical protein
MPTGRLREGLANCTILPHAKSWAVAWSVSHGEKALETFLDRLNVPCYVPRVLRRRAYSGRVKTWTPPLFPGYIFYDSSLITRPQLFESRKVADILIPPNSDELHAELSQIAQALQLDASLREIRYGTPGQPVVVVRGVLAGLSGELVRIESQSRLILKISFLNKAVELAIDEGCVEPAL